ncbi:prospero homeobox protein 2 isoform X2 [Brachyhypopomus gauderio]|uniref:prospero homeobox protein 2 isoform X2 n=1 Tax=Brachyhypopomus gauderio TaxID=698409 RepID=UPI004041924F
MSFGEVHKCARAHPHFTHSHGSVRYAWSKQQVHCTNIWGHCNVLIHQKLRSKYNQDYIAEMNLTPSGQSPRKLNEDNKADLMLHSFRTGSGMTESALEDRSNMSSKDSLGGSVSPGGHHSSVGSAEPDHPLSKHHQAKRARVENIIRGMAGSPNDRPHGEGESVEGDPSRYGREAYKENKRKQKLPQHQEHGHLTAVSPNSSSSLSKDEECQKLREQLQSMQRLLHQLQEKFLQMYDHNDTENGEKEEEDLQQDIHDPRLDWGTKPEGKRQSYVGQVKEDSGYLGSDRDQKDLQEMLKCELSRAVSQSVDVVFRKFSADLQKQSPLPRLCLSPACSADMEKQTQKACPPEVHYSEDVQKLRPLEHYEITPAHSPDHQTEALSLVVQKPALNQLGSENQSVKRPFPLHQSPFQFSYSAPLHDTQILEHILKYGPHANFGVIPCLPASLERTSPDSMDIAWESLAMRPKVSSGHLGQQHRPGALRQVTVDGLHLPHVKMECGDLQSMAERNTFMSLNIQEGLTPNHLKKAKLMFFYTRYPSSNVLKTFFPDVKFNRCITSQLIKWFSNFREFYYIQMEKFARQAIVDGVSDVKDMSVSRDSELFRALNMHYNKANDFQIPDRFLEVAEITLHEFYNAISLNKDSDPSWKKAIYKVICKLDSDVPDDFKSPSYL